MKIPGLFRQPICERRTYFGNLRVSQLDSLGIEHFDRLVVFIMSDRLFELGYSIVQGMDKQLYPVACTVFSLYIVFLRDIGIDFRRDDAVFVQFLDIADQKRFPRQEKMLSELPVDFGRYPTLSEVEIQLFELYRSGECFPQCGQRPGTAGVVGIFFQVIFDSVSFADDIPSYKTVCNFILFYHRIVIYPSIEFRYEFLFADVAQRGHVFQIDPTIFVQRR